MHFIMRSVATAREAAAFQATTVSTAQAAIQTANAQVAATQARLATVVAQKKAARMALEEARVTLDAKSQMIAQLQGDGADQETQQSTAKKGKAAGCVTGSIKVRCVLVSPRCTLKSVHDHTACFSRRR
jgi:hypothetical protein